jgi:hypothetical protein
MLAMVVMASSKFNHVDALSLFVAYQVGGFIGRWKIDSCIRLCLLVRSQNSIPSKGQIHSMFPPGGVGGSIGESPRDNRGATKATS